MIPEIGKKYLIWYEPYPSFFKSEQQRYRGVAIYSGNSILESDGTILYWFDGVDGIPLGWFHEDDIFFYEK